VSLVNETITTRLTTQIDELISSLRKRHYTLSLAESCTGGLLSALITRQAGVSDVYVGAVVSYANTAKEQILGVRAQTLKELGAVSESVALEMAQSAKRIFAAALSIAITGVAGPTGGTKEKPIGLVCFAFCGPDFEFSLQHQFLGTRNQIQEAAVAFAIDSVLKKLNAK
jgi:PncC family amidohydrolase